MGRAMDMKNIVLVILLHWYVFFSTTLNANCHTSPNILCIEKEKEALLTFKQYVKDPSNRLSSWSGNECCVWRGISCDNITGHVIKLNLTNPSSSFQNDSTSLGGFINDSLKELNHLQYLDLSWNNFENKYIPSCLGSFQNLKYLNLTEVGYDMKVDNLEWLSNLSLLEVLDMSTINLSGVLNSSQITFGSLTTLDLSYTSISVQVVFDILTLRNLYLCCNSYTIIPNWLCNITSLERLDLSTNNIARVLPDDINFHSHLKYLDLSRNKVKGKFPISLGNLCNLICLDFSSNNLEGELYEFLGNSSGGSVKTLEYLDLGANSFSGALPNQLGKLQKLSVLDLWHNSFSGLIPMSIGKLLSLKVLHVSSNQLNGTIPTSLGNLWNLEELYIDDNKLEGSISELHFSNLTRLKIFSTSLNQLKLVVQSDWIPPFQLQSLRMESTKVGPQFPTWIESQKDLQDLDLSYSRIVDVIPSWFWSYCSQIQYLKLSHNQIHGNIPSLFCGEEVYLGSNNFSGPLPYFSPTIKYLDLSDNSFHGSLSPIFSEERNRKSDLEMLDLSGNSLYGELPNYWMNYSNLNHLDLGDNNLMGNIPNSLGTILGLHILSLYKNNLSGNLPLSLLSCRMLTALDLSENNLEGNLPIGLGNSFLMFEVLALRSNKFNGNIPKYLCDLRYLRILDLSQNNFSGSIPSCFGYFLGMRKEPSKEGYLFDDKAFLITKGGEHIYGQVTLELLTSMDLSSNSLIGKIPKELTNLCWLRYLNLSKNHLYGRIPENISAMKQLETLDVSMNQLTGIIPQGVASLTFLNNLNLSHNDLSGRIPTSTQLQSLSPFNFIGNQNLYGPPLTAPCPGDNTSPKPVPSVGNGGNEYSGWMVKKWFYMGALYGFVVGFWVVLVPLAFNRAWRYAYYKFWDDVKDQLLVVSKS